MALLEGEGFAAPVVDTSTPFGIMQDAWRRIADTHDLHLVRTEILDRQTSLIQEHELLLVVGAKHKLAVAYASAFGVWHVQSVPQEHHHKLPVMAAASMHEILAGAIIQYLEHLEHPSSPGMQWADILRGVELMISAWQDAFPYSGG